MSDPKVVAAHKEGGSVFVKWSDGDLSTISLANLSVLGKDDDPDGHVWRAITGLQGQPASAAPQELVENRKIRALMALAWNEDTGGWRNAAKSLFGIQAILDDEGRGIPASPVSADSPELAALREIDKVLDQNWVADIWLNRDETLDAIHGLVRRVLPEPYPMGKSVERQFQNAPTPPEPPCGIVAEREGEGIRVREAGPLLAALREIRRRISNWRDYANPESLIGLRLVDIEGILDRILGPNP